MKTILTKAILHRSVEPEILDGLPPADAGAVAARRDLILVNRLMLNAGRVASLCRRHLAEPPRRMLEIGCGDGRFMLSVAKRLAKRWSGVEVVLLDRADIVAPELAASFEKRGWRVEAVTADVFEWLGSNSAERFDVITANLFLHHFDDDGLVRLFTLLKPLAPVFLATEPCRAAFPLAATRLLKLLGASSVTQHDAPASIRAGFTAKEISGPWQAAGGTPLEERRAGLFTHVFAGSTAMAPR
jgi:2-polyprenyl-3-methyl-5-hydroxy-6-metoxy-1,4-benzoquinol methylase